MNFEDLTPEQKEKALACKTPDELLELAKEEGYDLTEEQLQSVSGGSWGDCSGYVDYCPKNCGGNFYC